MNRVRETSRWRDVGVSLAIIGVLLLGGTYGPVGGPGTAGSLEPDFDAGSLQSCWRAIILDIRASWRGVFGEAQNSGYQLYASMGSITNAEMPAHIHPVNGDLGPLIPLR